MTKLLNILSDVLVVVLKTGLVSFLKEVLPYISQQSNSQFTIADNWIVRHIGAPTDGEGFAVTWSVRMKLRQFGRIVWGTANATCMDGESTGTQVSYRVTGKYSDGLLTACFCGNEASSRNRSTFLLQPFGDGNTLNGWRLFLGRTKNDIRAIACQWVRSSNQGATCGTA